MPCDGSSDLTCDQQTVLLILNGICTSFSVIGELYLIYHFVKEPKNREFPLILVLGLVMADLTYSTANLMVYIEFDPVLCTIQGYLREIALMSDYLWSIQIIYTTYKFQKYGKTEKKEVFKKSIPYNLGISMIPASIVLIGQFIDPTIMSYQDDLSFCDMYPNGINLLFSELPQAINGIIAVSLGIMIYNDFRQNGKTDITSLRILLYPAMNIVVQIPVLANRITYFILSKPLFPLIFIQILMLRLSGLFNALIFGRNRAFRTYHSERPSHELPQSIIKSDDERPSLQKRKDLEQDLLNSLII